MSEIEFWFYLVPQDTLLAVVSWSFLRYGAVWLLLLLAVGVLGSRPEPRPSPRSLSPRERRRRKRQRNPDGTKRRWRRGQRVR
jgi:hypothetical protein